MERQLLIKSLEYNRDRVEQEIADLKKKKENSAIEIDINKRIRDYSEALATLNRRIRILKDNHSV